MTLDPGNGDRGHSLREDLLADLRQGSTRTPSPGSAPAPEPRFPSAPAEETPTVELRFTPRSWSPAGWSPLPSGAGFVVNVGPVQLSVGRRSV